MRDPYRQMPDLRSWWTREVEQAKAESRDPQLTRHGRMLLLYWACARELRACGHRGLWP